ncbi:type II toxin-antitoxin system VapC family toxin [Siccirubricoccus sp. KC 17139]|uniref:Ribonuclease VapC n=1 Tax=Siccirubricoccus soli TaxID=2899147 RepID=A0ABT1DBU7_9PROT|nr:type II toxin-antitoxin system VapC family toxin [Siccirubricoccus soli]MCO6418690.1 type II toxin-antitoxin system VapC family toxin [Siccirubricoccus soli]MCP2684825.1 type II toxin-antitoxin system VapC family toxin [Siccirubricoccus soli]
MIVDTSALIAILFKEAEARDFISAIDAAEAVAIAAPTLVEATLASEGRVGPAMRLELDDLVRTMQPEIVPFTAELAAIAQDGWRRYGKGRHPAGLNLGDCFAYALAKSRGEPLLFKGEDFARTDVKAALPPHA